MAVRQHILPRFLLKGFATKVKNKEFYVWVYQKDKNPFRTNITKISVEKFFYGEEGEDSLDNKITELEQDFAPLLDELRAEHGVKKLADNRVVDLVVHFITRTKHVRDSFGNPAIYLMDKLADHFSDFNNALRALGDNPKYLRAAIEKKVDELPVPFATKQVIINLLIASLPLIISRQKKELTKQLGKFANAVRQEAPEMIKGAHISALSENLLPEQRKRRYSELQWYSCETAGDLILGDVGCFFEVAGDKRFISFDMKGDAIFNIWLPISSNHILVGTKSKSAPPIETDLLNEAVAKLSRDYYMASQDKPEFRSLQPLLGTKCEMTSEEDLDKIIEKKLPT